MEQKDTQALTGCTTATIQHPRYTQTSDHQQTLYK